VTASAAPDPARVLVAGIGNVFLGDDGFGPEVARRLAADGDLPDGVEVADIGIRGVHLAYELLDGCELLIMVDASPRGGEPGSVYVIEPGRAQAGPAHVDPSAAFGGDPLIDAHGMEPESVLALVETLGGSVGRVLVVGCEPASVTERMGLSEPVSRAVEPAARVVRELLEEAARTSTGTTPGKGS
jgi:hydrogenase maturation protease